MSQPSFWLKVSKKYVIENFENLLEYIHRYEYSADAEGQSDFKESVDCLAETAADLAAQCRLAKIWERPQLETDPETAVRIMAASVLARKKMGIDDHDGILDLTQLLLCSGQQLTPDEARALLQLTIACVCCRPIETFGFSFASITKANFMPGAFPSLLGATKIGTDSGHRAEFEGKGCLEISVDGIVAAPMNLETFRRVKLKPTLDGSEWVKIVEHDEKRPSGIEEMLEYYGPLSAKLDRVAPSPVRPLAKYSAGSQMLAEVVSIISYNVFMRTLSPGYQTLEGRLYVPKIIAFSATRETFIRQLTVGSVFTVERSDRSDFIFNLSNENFSEFLSDYGKVSNGEKSWAVFKSNFRTGIGTRWLNDEGFPVNVFGYVPEGVDTSGDAQQKVSLVMRGISTDNTGKSILMAEFDRDGEVEVENCDVREFEKEAPKVFCDEYLEWCKSAANVPEKKKVEDARRIGADAVAIAGRLLEAMADDPGLSTPGRIETLTIAMTLLKMAGRSDGDAYVRHRLDYLRAIADFAAGSSPISLKLHRPAALLDVEEARLRDLVIERLHDYKEQEISHTDSVAGNVPGSKPIDKDTPEVIRQLVDASNILIGKIDNAEIHRIKKSIATRLGVPDCYHNSYDGLPYYGDETETLELKKSCSYPPLNRRTTSTTKDLEVQKYAILKGVCAFLNSPQGGDLLVGVADSGYAAGLKEDIDRLYTSHVISEPTADRVRIYIKNAIDRAFTTLDGSMSGPAITADYVSCNIETPRDNIEVLRIRVKPFPWDVVKFAAPDGSRPEGLADVYSRTSGASTPMSSDGIRAIKLRKTAGIGSENAKLLPIMEAIDGHRCVMLCGYASSSGISDRKIEPHRVLIDMKAVQAFDLKTRSMRLFKLHRVTSVERTTDRWKNEMLHCDMAVDIFGTMQSDENPGERVKIKLTDYAYSLLREEFPKAASQAEVTPNNGPDRNRYGRILTTEIYNPAGIGRFILGLYREIEVLEGRALKAYLHDYLTTP